MIRFCFGWKPFELLIAVSTIWLVPTRVMPAMLLHHPMRCVPWCSARTHAAVLSVMKIARVASVPFARISISSKQRSSSDRTFGSIVRARASASCATPTNFIAVGSITSCQTIRSMQRGADCASEALKPHDLAISLRIGRMLMIRLLASRAVRQSEKQNSRALASSAVC